MAVILTFLGKGGTGKTTLAIGAAKRFASQGKRVLLALTSPASALLLGQSLDAEPQEIKENLQGVQLLSTPLLAKGWQEVKQLEAEYLQKPFFQAVFGEELGVLPGMDSSIRLYALWKYDASGNYDAIVYDGDGDLSTLRMLGTPEIFSWYIRRFRQVFVDSELGQALSPFVGPVSAAVLNGDWSADNFAQPTQQVDRILDEGKAKISDPQQVAAYLVTTDDPGAIATARYLWGSAQQVGLTVRGVILNKSVVADTEAAKFAESLSSLLETFDDEATNTSQVKEQFAPLPVSVVPFSPSQEWEAIMSSLPDFSSATQAPRPLTINVNVGRVTLFLPGFDKKQVKLTQYGPEITIEAGDQRRNILLPKQLSGKPVKGAKFQDDYLIISF
ncbi:MAG: ArsA family ATPase [Hormoscilla sp. SP5CHS1]|nr:ArsA family ATPase [Hormoscilla sp. SP12CHS1]MBC6454918.1 ArsA family ATPase [Hormoscilla sp. SP5CHS1]